MLLSEAELLYELLLVRYSHTNPNYTQYPYLQELQVNMEKESSRSC